MSSSGSSIELSSEDKDSKAVVLDSPITSPGAILSPFGSSPTESTPSSRVSPIQEQGSSGGGGSGKPFIGSMVSASTVAECESLLETSMEKLSKAGGTYSTFGPPLDETKKRRRERTSVSTDSPLVRTQEESKVGQLVLDVKSGSASFASIQDLPASDQSKAIVTRVESYPPTTTPTELLTSGERVKRYWPLPQPTQPISIDREPLEERQDKDSAIVKCVAVQSSSELVSSMPVSSDLPSPVHGSLDVSQTERSGSLLPSSHGDSSEGNSAISSFLRSLTVSQEVARHLVVRSTGPLDFIRNVLMACQVCSLNLSDSIILVPFQVTIALLSMSPITLGIFNLNTCPMSTAIPIMILAMGIVGFLIMALRAAYCVYDFTVQNPRHLDKLRYAVNFGIALFLVLFACEAFLFFKLTQSSDVNSSDYCNPAFHTFCYVLNIGLPVLMVIMLTLHGPAFLYRHFDVGRNYIRMFNE